MDKTKEILDSDALLNHYSDLMRQKLHNYINNYPDDLDYMSWRDCTVEHLWNLLQKSIEDKDLVSVGNYAMFIFARDIVFSDFYGEA